MNFLDQLLENLNKGSVPNHFTRAMGELIKKAREESGYSQRELASKIYRRQAALSEMENGLMQPDAETLLTLSYYLKKPISYFFPKRYMPEPEEDSLSEEEKSLLMEVRRLDEDDLKRVIAQVRAIAQLYDREEENDEE